MRTVVLLVSTCALAAAAFGDVVGEYQGSGTNPGGQGSYTCDVAITKSGDVYAVQWFFDGELGYEGVGIVKDDLFCVGYTSSGSYGVVVYEVKADGSLDGTWTGAGATNVGTEKLKRK
ncbi:MAG: hypothetical protein GTN49_11150 [candidate division Zixibacteria bacterium]|nr:hypothetical protein [candidate division Zixibacteria bacterium]